MGVWPRLEGQCIGVAKTSDPVWDFELIIWYIFTHEYDWCGLGHTTPSLRLCLVLNISRTQLAKLEEIYGVAATHLTGVF